MIPNNNITEQQKSADENRRGETYEADFCPHQSASLNLDSMGSISHAELYSAIGCTARSDAGRTSQSLLTSAATSSHSVAASRGIASGAATALAEDGCDSSVQPQKSQGAAAAAPYPDKVDAIQAAVERMPQVELPLTHRFTPGMYIRTIFMPKGALVISKIHRTQHPFVVTKGRCVVWAACAAANTGIAGPGNEGRWVEINAGHIGVTMPGTRRIIYICEDTEWTTFHATDKTTPEEVEADIIEPHEFDREEALAQLGRMIGLVDNWMDGQDSPSPRPSPPGRFAPRPPGELSSDGLEIRLMEPAKQLTANIGLPKTATASTL